MFWLFKEKEKKDLMRVDSPDDADGLRQEYVCSTGSTCVCCSQRLVKQKSCLLMFLNGET